MSSSHALFAMKIYLYYVMDTVIFVATAKAVVIYDDYCTVTTENCNEHKQNKQTKQTVNDYCTAHVGDSPRKIQSCIQYVRNLLFPLKLSNFEVT